jgi:hypothetical protein
MFWLWHEQYLPSSLKTTQEDRFLCKNALQITSLWIPPLLSSFISFYPTQGHPFEAFNIHSNNYLQHGFKVLQKKVPSQMYLVFQITFISISLDFFCLHHSLASTSHIIYPLLKQHVYFVKSLALQSSPMISVVVHPPKFLKKNYWQEEKLTPEKHACLTPSFCLLFYLPPSIMQTSLQCNNSFHHP